MEAYTGFAEVYDIFQDNVPMKSGAAMSQDFLRNTRSRMDWCWTWVVGPAA